MIVLAHEYCGQAGCKRYLAMLADVLSVDGAVVFNAEFGDPQKGNAHGWLKSRDLACAVRFARSRAASYGGDPSRVTLVSHLSASWSAATVALDGDAHVARQLPRDGRIRVAGCLRRDRGRSEQEPHARTRRQHRPPGAHDHR